MIHIGMIAVIRVPKHRMPWSPIIWIVAIIVGRMPNNIRGEK